MAALGDFPFFFWLDGSWPELAKGKRCREEAECSLSISFEKGFVLFWFLPFFFFLTLVQDWGLSPEEKLVRAVVVILEEKREELGYSLYDYEWYTNSDLPQEGKGDLIFVSLPKKSVLVVEVKAVLESHSDSGRKKALKRAKLKKQVEKYMGHAKSLFPEEANIHGMGITDEETVLYQVENQLLKEKWLEDNEWVRWEPQKPIPGEKNLDQQC